MAAKYEIRRAVYSDAPRLAEIHIMGWRNAYRGIVKDDYLFGRLRVEKSITSFAQRFPKGARRPG